MMWVFFEEEKLELSETLIVHVEGASSSTVDTNQPFIDSRFLVDTFCFACVSLSKIIPSL